MTPQQAAAYANPFAYADSNFTPGQVIRFATGHVAAGVRSGYQETPSRIAQDASAVPCR